MSFKMGCLFLVISCFDYKEQEHAYCHVLESFMDQECQQLFFLHPISKDF